MSVSGFDHIYVETRHFDRSLEFWQALGLEVVASWGEGEHRACRLSGKGAQVVLAEAGSGHDPQRATVHFAVENPEALDASLRQANAVDVISPLEATHWGTRWIRVRDPDGNLYALEASGD
jgi:catechol 2,3-dioxygenase-like lactoylglutathione lyase family enzyme